MGKSVTLHCFKALCPSWNARPSKNFSKVVEVLVKVGASLNAYNAFIYSSTGPNACGFWLSLTVFIDSYELTIEVYQYQTLLWTQNTGQQVAVFHSKLCPNLHTNHWSYLEVPSRALTKCTGCTCWMFQTGDKIAKHLHTRTLHVHCDVTRSLTVLDGHSLWPQSQL